VALKTPVLGCESGGDLDQGRLNPIENWHEWHKTGTSWMPSRAFTRRAGASPEAPTEHQFPSGAFRLADGADAGSADTLSRFVFSDHLEDAGLGCVPRAGANAKALSTYMGRANISITLDRYGHLNPGNEVEFVGLLDAFLAHADTAARLNQVSAGQTPCDGGRVESRAAERAEGTIRGSVQPTEVGDAYTTWQPQNTVGTTPSVHGRG
jgi:hypothetical protein